MKKKLFIISLFIASRGFSQQIDFFKPDSVKKKIRAVKILSALKVDGKLKEEEWRFANPSPSFIQVEPNQGRAARYRTEVRVLYNREYLYFGITAMDPGGKNAIRATDFVRDFDITRHDLVSLSFDAFNDKRNAMSFATNAYGVQRDLLAFDDLYTDIDWDGLWTVRTSRTDSGWVAEIAIPWKTLRYPVSTDSIQNWGFNVYRNRRLTNEISALAPFPRAYSANRMDYAGVLTNLQPPPPGTNIRIQPYLLSAYDHYSDPGLLLKTQQTSIKAGGDLKWAINTNSVLDLTAHTDFAQSEADLQVNNLSRFSVFFPEKRQFFLENASLFGIGIGPAADGSGGTLRFQPFFSRSIGLDTSGNPVPVVGGGRFVYRSSKLNFGAMAIRQASFNDMPGTNFFVGRLSANLNQQDRLGFLFNIKNTPQGSNFENTVDGFFRFGAANSLSTILTHSVTTPSGKQGFGGIAQYYYSTNDYKIWLTESLVTKDFDPQTGFVSRKDIIGTSPGINYYYRGKLLPFQSFIRAFEPSFVPEIYYQASTGKLEEVDLPFWPLWLNLQNGGWFACNVTSTIQNLTSIFQPLGVTIATGHYRYLEKQVYFSTDPSRAISLSVNYIAGTYFDGHLHSGDFKVQLAPIPYISVTAELNSQKLRDVGINRSNQLVNLYIIQTRLALNPQIQLSGIYQKNSLNNSDYYNIRFSWEFLPLSYVYLIYNRGVNYSARQHVQTEDHLIAKISYLRQF